MRELSSNQNAVLYTDPNAKGHSVQLHDAEIMIISLFLLPRVVFKYLDKSPSLPISQRLLLQYKFENFERIS